MSASMSLPTERYALLLEQLGAELGHVRGWKRRVADRLGVHPSYVSRILSGEKLTIGPDVIDRACQRLSLGHDFFFAKRDTPPDYRDFLRSTLEKRAEAKAAAGLAEDYRRRRAAALAAIAFLRSASELNSSPAQVDEAAQALLAAARDVPIVHHALALSEAIGAGDAASVAGHAWKLAGALLVEVSPKPDAAARDVALTDELARAFHSIDLEPHDGD